MITCGAEVKDGSWVACVPSELNENVVSDGFSVFLANVLGTSASSCDEEVGGRPNENFDGVVVGELGFLKSMNGDALGAAPPNVPPNGLTVFVLPLKSNKLLLGAVYVELVDKVCAPVAGFGGLRGLAVGAPNTPEAPDGAPNLNTGVCPALLILDWVSARGTDGVPNPAKGLGLPLTPFPDELLVCTSGTNSDSPSSI